MAKKLSDDEKRFVQCYLDTYEEYNIVWKCIEKVMSSQSKLSIIQMQDFLELGSEARMNIPGTAYGNWEWRATKDSLSSELLKRFMKLLKNIIDNPKMVRWTASKWEECTNDQRTIF